MVRASTVGAPNWVDLSTPDPDGAARFYGELFGWTIDVTPSPMGPYLIAHVGDRQVGGMMAPSPGEAELPSMWTVFVYVADLDDVLGRVATAGGAILESPIDLPDGRVAVVADPVGAMFGLITGPAPDGVWVSPAHGSVCWVELLSRDPAAAEPFYTQVFGWTPEAQGGANPYTTFVLDGEAVDGMMQMPATVPAEAPSYWGIYVAVGDCDATAGRATELGGTVLVPPTTVGTQRFAVLADPYGATFSIMRTDPGAPAG